MTNAELYPNHPWVILRNGKECARSRTRAECDRIIRQLKKIYKKAEFTVKYQGKNISHCTDGGKPID